MGFKQYLATLTILSVSGIAVAKCYFPNGTDRNLGFPQDTYLPINTGDDFSMCCSRLGDQPRSDGLCMNADGTVIWRESCTDRTWESPKCIKLCADESPDTNNSPGVGRQMDNDEQVTPCFDGSYCCGDGAMGSTCCDQGRGVFIRDGTTQAANPTLTSTSSTSSSAAPSLTTTIITSTGIAAGSTRETSSPAAAGPQSSGSNTGAIAGGVVGGIVGLGLILAIAWVILRKRRRPNGPTPSGIRQGNDHWYPQDHKPSEPQEAQGSYTGEIKRSELQAGPIDKTMGRSELGTNLAIR
ncbi:MAG: hypothetical protein Q9219_005885 [cf. Caloplaca sp. 3 TL-2023]